MRILRGIGLAFFLALFLISSSFADDAKGDDKDKKDQPSTASAPATPAADGTASPAAASTPTTSAPSSPAKPAPKPAPKPEPKPQRSLTGDESEQVPKFIPMPALDGNPGLFTLETGDTLPARAFDLSIGVNK